MTVKSTSANSEKLMAVCRKCHKTCLDKNKTNSSNASNGETTDINANRSYSCKDPDDRVVQGFSDESNWGGPHSSTATLSPTDPFLPVPHISVQPPTPTTTAGSGGHQTTGSSGSGNNINNNFDWDSDSPKRQQFKVNHSHITRQFYAESSSIGTALDDAREQLMFDRLLSGMSIMGSLVPLCPVTRGFPQRRRLDPLMEDVEEDSSDSTMEFLRGSKSEEHTSSSGNRLTRLFSRESQDDIPTTLPPDFIQKREHDKTLDRRFWKQLRKRRSSNDATAKGSGSGT
ncbi:unnamed protein product [Nesidiocoris tenuis]|uniref:Uncharacterized protein n=1 Tax=Nesidiocoris tenuis TaxID=355587 RepID=A0A6H5HHU3_9HEMI|nr:unnamed protein product [Nesidiocoris tenuis]